MSWVIRYVPTSDLGRRFTGHSQPFATRTQAERMRLACTNSADMETIESEEQP